EAVRCGEGGEGAPREAARLGDAQVARALGAAADALLTGTGVGRSRRRRRRRSRVEAEAAWAATAPAVVARALRALSAALPLDTERRRRPYAPTRSTGGLRGAARPDRKGVGGLVWGFEPEPEGRTPRSATERHGAPRSAATVAGCVAAELDADWS